MSTLLSGRYRPTSNTFSGGSGSVVICEDTNLERKVAIKFLLPQGQRRRIFDEIGALQKIRSKNVVQIYDIIIEQPDNRIGIVQEFLPGEDLRAFTKGALPPDDYLLLLYQITCGLTDIHAQGLIHRDLKPNNIKADQENLLKIFDFDLARPEGGDAQTTGFRGTYGYAAPELYRHGIVPFSIKADIYSLGATALFLATGSLPAELVEIPPRPSAWTSAQGFSSILPTIPEQILTLLDSTLSPSPNDRPTAQELRNALADQLLAERHRALLVHNGISYTCDKDKRAVSLQRNGVGSIKVTYTGTCFTVEALQGDVLINNQTISAGYIFCGSCVIAFGGRTLPPQQRSFITLDISHPEVVL